MKLHSILFLLAILVIACPVFGQTLTISVLETDKKPLPGAAVELKSITDSAKMVALTDNTGMAVFEKLPQGIYTLHITFLGFQPVEKTILVKSVKQRYEFQLSEEALSLGEVTVKGNRPLIRQEDDKMIIDPEPLVNISTNTLEILESTPGLFVDTEGSIYLSTSSPAVILINGREQKMGSQDIATILRGLPPGSVKQIEVIRSPSSKYAASSSGGIINIVLKKGMKAGRFGSLNLGMNQGYYGNRFVGFSINNMTDRKSSYLNLNYSNNAFLEELGSVRLLETADSLFQDARTNRKAHQTFLGYGLSYEIGKNKNFNYDGRISGSLPDIDTRNTNLISDPFGQEISNTLNHLKNKNSFVSVQQDFGLSIKLDTLGSEWDSKLSYSFNRSRMDQHYLVDQLLPLVFQFSGNGVNEQNRHFIQFRSDFTYILPKKITFETGINLNWQDYQSASDFTLDLSETNVPDTMRTRSYQYRENIMAGYIQASVPLPSKFLLKGGIRMEHTYMLGRQTIPADTSFLVRRSDWFPYVYLSRELLSIAGFKLRSYLIYRKTITRPDYNSLNPYINYVDQFLYETGNPGLNPQFANNIEVNISMDDMPIFAIGKNYTSNIFSSVIYQDPVLENVLRRTFDNLGKSNETYFRAMAGIPPGKRYFFMIGTQYNYNHYEGFYENEPLNWERGSWRFFTFHSLRLAKETRLTVNGFMMTKGQMGFYELGNMGQLNIALIQNFFNKKITLTLSARDILRTMQTDFTLNQGKISTTGSRYSDNQRFGINLRYNFGIKSKQEKQNPMQFDMENMGQ
jgi:iron complex outermembrane recepter protein